MSGLLNTAITGIRLNQAAMSVTGHNIVNANTEGYSRQSIQQSTNTALKTSAGYLGTGVNIDQIIRHTEKYLQDQVIRDIGTLSEADTYLSQVSQINNLLASEQTNIASYLNDFFDAVNESINDPGSLLGRELLLTQAKQLTAGFKAVESRLQDQNTAVNKQLVGVAENITSLGKQISELNQLIGDAMGNDGRVQPNDMMDQRDMLVRQLGEYVQVNTVAREDGGLDVFIGQGQALVVGSSLQTVKAVPGSTDASRYDLVFESRAGTQVVNKLMTGGQAGALLRFREEALEPSASALGLLATGVAASINEQNRLGMDLEGSLGGDIFTSVNNAQVARNRVKASMENLPPADRNLNVTIDNISQLKASDYELRFTGPGREYTVTRLSDNKVVNQGILPTTYPQTASMDGFSINFEEGSFRSGDRFLLQPTRNGATDLNVQINRAEEFAFASPIRVSENPANQGGVQLVSSTVQDISTDFFDKKGQLNPPLMVRFTSATTYEVLDYSDPANPKALTPPMSNLPFVPGSNNALFPSDPGGQTIVSQGASVGQIIMGGATNGYPGEQVFVQTTDPDTGFIREQRLTLGADESADSMARRLNSLTGVSATAYNNITLSDFSGAGLELSLNGVNLTDPNFVLPGEATPDPVPSPLTADFLRDRINSSPDLQAQGIYAKSDGSKLTIHATSGADFKFQVDGAGSFLAGEAAQLVNAPAPGDPALDMTVGGRVDVQLAANSQMQTNQANGVFGSAPAGVSNYLGIQVTMSSGSGPDGQPKAGDSFVIGYNQDGTADNRNGSAMLALGDAKLFSDGNQSFHDSYGQLAESVGILTSQARINQNAGESMLRQSMDAMQSVSGVNLEEEAARLIQLEQHYNASARLITLARDLFDVLMRI